ncbi:MAG: phosphate ABC transporter permease subunit PstC [Phycisphaerae bacterium]|nr:phosphate ABC transporter permease subunit PstC [Phycisphaerae bacterium]
MHKLSTIKTTASSRDQTRADLLFRGFTALCAIGLILIVVGIFIELLMNSWPAIKKFGLSFLVSQKWNPVPGIEEFGALSSIFGTLATTAIAMLIATPMSLVIAIFLVELAPPRMAGIVGGAIELLAAVPSIIYGMWGLFVFAPFMQDHIQPFLGEVIGGPLFEGPPMGIGILTAGIILALMILPFITAVARDVFLMIPNVVKEASHGMGATTWEVTYKVVWPYCIHGIVGALFLGLGRAIGETMAITFVIGNDHSISASVFSAGTSIASTLANEFTEASEPIYLSALFELGLVLFGLTVVFQIVAQLWLRRLRKSTGGRA